MQTLCLNCSEEVTKKFCPACGQKAGTHRITFSSFFLHDLLHGVWHIERGMLFTIKEALVRPGKAALDYIAGKRIRYYNVFYLCLLIIGLHFVLDSLYAAISPPTASIFTHEENDVKIVQFFSTYLRLIVLALVPLTALNAYLIFKRLGLNLAEHFILGGMNLLGVLILSVPFFFFNFLNELNVPLFMGIFEVFFFFLALAFPFWTYWNAARKCYNLPGMLWRIVIFNLLLYTEIVLIVTGIFLLITGKSEIKFTA